MQDQLTSAQTNLQQPRSDLQPTTSGLQPSGTPATSTGTTDILNQPMTSGQLKVQSTTTQVSTPSQNTNDVDRGIDPVLLLLLIPVLLAAAMFWPRKKPAPYVEPINEQLASIEPPQPATVNKVKKKKSKRKKTGKR